MECNETLGNLGIDYKVLVINDASTGVTVEVVRSLAVKNLRVRYHLLHRPRAFGFAVLSGLDTFKCDARRGHRNVTWKPPLPGEQGYVFDQRELCRIDAMRVAIQFVHQKRRSVRRIDWAHISSIVAGSIPSAVQRRVGRRRQTGSICACRAVAARRADRQAVLSPPTRGVPARRGVASRLRPRGCSRLRAKAGNVVRRDLLPAS